MSDEVVVMINKLNLCYDILEKTSLSKEIAEKFAEENDKFFEDINDTIEDVSAYEAIDIISFLISANKYFISKQQWENLIYICLTMEDSGVSRFLSGAFFGRGSALPMLDCPFCTDTVETQISEVWN